MIVYQCAIEPGVCDAEFRLQFYQCNEEIHAAEFEQFFGKKMINFLWLRFLH